MKRTNPIFFIFIGVLLILCCCAIALLGGVFVFIQPLEQTIATIAAYPPGFAQEPTASPPRINRQSVDQIPADMVEDIRITLVPENDLSELACRFKGICNIPSTLSPPAIPYTVGARQSFWVSNDDTNEYFQVSATLQFITPHAYFWVENGIEVDEQAVQMLMDTFETQIYPTDRSFFGSEWTPGVDGDVHLYILYAGGLGSSVAGYFYSPDEYNPVIRPKSNGHEMFYISTSEPLDAPYTFGTLAHEFQHMIHWHIDRNEGAFLNEGLSELAVFINGYDPGGFDWYYLRNPDIILTDWVGSAGENSEHYGANFLFVTYFMDRFGAEMIKALIQDPQNGLDSIDAVLARNNLMDPATGLVITAEDLFLDWTITNYVQDADVGDGRYQYHNYPNAPQARDTERITACPLGVSQRFVNQFGVDYIHVECETGTNGIAFASLMAIMLVIACVLFLCAVVGFVLRGIHRGKTWKFYLAGGSIFAIIIISFFILCMVEINNRISANERVNYNLHFEGSTLSHLLPADPHSGDYAYWSNNGDESDMTLTHSFDLRGASGPVTLNYWTWYDIEKDFDFLYVEASSDGQNWEILETPSGTTFDPMASSYGWGYTGASNGWMEESVDLSRFAGMNIWIRFEYITDSGVNGEGFLLDDLTIPAIGYSSDFESADAGWEADGFIRVQNTIPQTYRLALINRGSNGMDVQIIPIATDQTADIPLTFGKDDLQDAILVVTATSRYTRQAAPYQIEIRPGFNP
jgi:hypothetical protein